MNINEWLDRESQQQAQEKSSNLKKEFFSNLRTGHHWIYISHDDEGIKFRVGDRIITITAGAAIVDYEECEGFLNYQVEEE